MAVENKYANTDIAAGNKGAPSIQSKAIAIVVPIAIAAADSDASIYHVARVPSSFRVHSLRTTSTTITGATDYDFGLYYADGSAAVIAKDILADGIDVSTAHAPTERLTTGTNALAESLVGKTLWEIAGLASDPHRDMTISVTANTVGTGAGTLTVIVGGTGN